MRLKRNGKHTGVSRWFFLFAITPEFFTSLGSGLLGSNCVEQKFHGVLCEQRNQQSIIHTGPVMCCKGWVPITDPILGGAVTESLFSL